MQINNKNLAEKIENLPESPGCYLWKNNVNQIIYIGKAKNIKKRTKQYFNNKDISSKIKLLVSQITDIDFIVTNNENDALILERNLIAKHKPKYNSLLREKGNYPYIVLTDDKNPRLVYTNDPEKFKGQKFGPFATQWVRKHEIFLLVNRLFKLRKCNKIPNKKCIYYDIGQCLGPCINKISEEQYKEVKKEINDFFNGNLSSIKKELKQKEIDASKKMEFENAQYFLELQKSIDHMVLENQTLFDKKLNVDVIGYYEHDGFITIMIFKYKDGELLETFLDNNFLLTETEEYVEKFILDYYDRKENVKKVYVDLKQETLERLSTHISKIEFINPKKGNFRELLILSTKNAKSNNDRKYFEMSNNLLRNETCLEDLKKLLDLDNLTVIELYDNSNLHNDKKIGVKVCYVNGYAEKSLYRKYNINDDSINSDFDMMQYVLDKRFSNLKEGDLIPNLIFMDGGKPQITAAIKTLSKRGLDKIINVAGLVKDNKHTTDRIIFNDQEIMLDKRSNLYLFLLKMQEEVHRFAITFFRDKKTQSLFENELLNINGIGSKTIKKLLANFTSIDNIKNASDEELSKFVSPKVIKNIRNHFLKS